jgi:hypothetical protein
MPHPFLEGLTMGRKLTEAEKVERAARRAEERDRAELGPLFAGQAEPVDRRALLFRRRQGQARAVEHMHTHLSAAAEFLDRLEADYLRRAVVALVGEAEAARRRCLDTRGEPEGSPLTSPAGPAPPCSVSAPPS